MIEIKSKISTGNDINFNTYTMFTLAMARNGE